MAHRRPFFKNPPKSRKRRAIKKRRKAAASRRRVKRGADGKFMKSVTRKGRKVTRAAWSRSGYRRNAMARRLPGRDTRGRFLKRRRASGGRRRRRNQPVNINPTRGRKRRYRRNPPAFSVQGMIRDVTEGLAGGAGVTAGRIATRQVVSMVKVDPATWIGVGAQGLVGIGARMVLKRFLRGGLAGAFADGVAYGAFNAAFEAGFRLLAPAQAAKLLGQDEYSNDELPLSAYPDARLLMAGYGAGQAADVQARQQLYGW